MAYWGCGGGAVRRQKHAISVQEMNATPVGMKSNTAACFKMPHKNINFSNKSCLVILMMELINAFKVPSPRKIILVSPWGKLGVIFKIFGTWWLVLHPITGCYAESQCLLNAVPGKWWVCEDATEGACLWIIMSMCRDGTDCDGQNQRHPLCVYITVLQTKLRVAYWLIFLIIRLIYPDLRHFKW